MKKYISKSLLVVGWMLILGGVLGASDIGNIGCRQALLQAAVVLVWALFVLPGGGFCAGKEKDNVYRPLSDR